MPIVIQFIERRVRQIISLACLVLDGLSDGERNLAALSEELLRRFVSHDAEDILDIVIHDNAGDQGDKSGGGIGHQVTFRDFHGLQVRQIGYGDRAVEIIRLVTHIEDAHGVIIAVGLRRADRISGAYNRGVRVFANGSVVVQEAPSRDFLAVIVEETRIAIRDIIDRHVNRESDIGRVVLEIIALRVGNHRVDIQIDIDRLDIDIQSH